MCVLVLITLFPPRDGHIYIALQPPPPSAHFSRVEVEGPNARKGSRNIRDAMYTITGDHIK